MVLVEALGMGKPCVAVNALGSSDVLANNLGGFTVESTPQALFEASLLLLKDPDLYHQKSREASERAKAFDSAKLASELVGYYEQVQL